MSMPVMADDRPTYDPAAVFPMREELHRVGVVDLLTPDAVDAAVDAPGTCLVVVNSVCGCAAGNARPGVMLALQNKTIPDRATAVFAGMEKRAVARAREKMTGVPPSSPSIALFKDGKLVHMIPRGNIENRTALQVAESLIQAFNANCSRQGPSVSPEEFDKIIPHQACGSSIPLNH